MFDMNRHRQERQSQFLKSANGFATCVAAIVCLLVTPMLHEATREFVSGLALGGYGSKWLSTVQALYMLLLYPTVFFALRASLSTAILAGATYCAIRFV